MGVMEIQFHNGFCYVVNQSESSDQSLKVTLHEEFPYLELFWSAFSRIRTEYGEILRISPYSVRIREIADQS